MGIASAIIRRCACSRSTQSRLDNIAIAHNSVRGMCTLHKLQLHRLVCSRQKQLALTHTGWSRRIIYIKTAPFCTCINFRLVIVLQGKR